MIEQGPSYNMTPSERNIFWIGCIFCYRGQTYKCLPNVWHCKWLTIWERYGTKRDLYGNNKYLWFEAPNCLSAFTCWWEVNIKIMFTRASNFSDFRGREIYKLDIAHINMFWQVKIIVFEFRIYSSYRYCAIFSRK